MNDHTDALASGETGENPIGRADPPILAVRRECGRGPATAGDPRAWICEVLADIGLLGGADGSSPEASCVDERSLRVVRWPQRPLVIGDVLDSGGSARRVVAKAYRDDRGAATFALLRRLGAGGLGRGDHRVTAPLGWSAGHRVLVTECAQGEPWSEFLVEGGPRLEAASAAVGGWLRTLHGVAEGPAGARLSSRADFRAEADMLREATRVGLCYPWYSRRLMEIARAATALSAESAARERRLVPSHGDLHPHNIHLEFAADRVAATALDLDTAGLRRPSYDVGYAIAQLLVMAYMRCGTFVPGASAAEVFRSTAAEPAGPRSADDAAVSAQVCRALVQSLHYELVTLENGREDLLPAWCGVAEEALSGGVSAMLARLLGGWRP